MSEGPNTDSLFGEPCFTITRAEAGQLLLQAPGLIGMATGPRGPGEVFLTPGIVELIGHSTAPVVGIIELIRKVCVDLDTSNMSENDQALYRREDLKTKGHRWFMGTFPFQDVEVWVDVRQHRETEADEWDSETTVMLSSEY